MQPSTNKKAETHAHTKISLHDAVTDAYFNVKIGFAKDHEDIFYDHMRRYDALRRDGLSRGHRLLGGLVLRLGM